MPTHRSLLLPALLCLGAPAAHATVRLPALVGSHMVLQRDAKLPLWGWAASGEKVTVLFRGKTYPATPGTDGRWQATLPPQPAGGPYAMTIKGQNTIELTDILVGDVWLASGQSNMQFKVKDHSGGYQPVQNADQEIVAANWPSIRLFTVAQTAAYRPQPEVPAAGWQVCSPATIADFSAVAYFFGRDLYQQYKIPMGLIADSWGGTPAEAWVSAEGLRPFPEFGARVADFAQRTTALADDQHAFDAQQRAFLQSFNTRDKGRLPGGRTWAAPDFDARAWPTAALPGAWETTTPALANYDGVVWFRKEIDLTAADAGRSLTLALGPIDDADSTWFNGVKVGGTTGYNVPRTYEVPAALVRHRPRQLAVDPARPDEVRSRTARRRRRAPLAIERPRQQARRRSAGEDRRAPRRRVRRVRLALPRGVDHLLVRLRRRHARQVLRGVVETPLKRHRRGFRPAPPCD